MKTLDCTLRDGGYYNNWEFPKDFVQKYLFACHQAGIDFIEVGLRSPNKKRFFGAHAFSTEGYLAELNPPAGLKIGVMINTSEFKDKSVDINDYFLPITKSCLSFVRIASHFNELSESLIIAKSLKDLGYTVGLNLMQISLQSDQEIIGSIALINNSPAIDVLYFADSLGDMKQNEVTNCFQLIRNGWNKDIGIHAHNNMGQALDNTLLANQLGVEWLDATILGMGRGAGNTEMELLLTELKERGSDKYYPSYLYPLVLEDFEPLKTRYQWGSSLLYYLAAKNKIHPTFIQELTSNHIFDHVDQMNAIDALSKIDSTKYAEVNTSKVLSNIIGTKQKKVDFKIPEGSDILILANGPSLNKYSSEIETFIKTRKPFVVSLNFTKDISDDLINLHALCNPARILSSLQKISSLKSKILIPLSQLDDALKEFLVGDQCFNYNLNIEDDLDYDEFGCNLKSPLVLGFALCALISNKKFSFYMAGFDGYTDNGAKNDTINNLLAALTTKEPQLSLLSITPTQYKIPQRSIYANGIIHNI
jgi:4-hydroxy 2-oxovalerate aldolase